MNGLWMAVLLMRGVACAEQVVELGSFDAAPDLPAEDFDVWVQQLVCDTEGYVYAVVGSRALRVDEGGPARPRPSLLNKLGPTGDIVWSVRVESQLDYSAAAPLQAVDMAWSPDGCVFVLAQDRVVRLDAGEGGYLGEWGQRGMAPGQLQDPTSIGTTHSGVVYVCDQACGSRGAAPGTPITLPLLCPGYSWDGSKHFGRVQAFTAAGKLVAPPWWCSGSQIAVGAADGSVYVLDAGKGWVAATGVGGTGLHTREVALPAVFRFDPWGHPLEVGHPAAALGKLALDPSDRLYLYSLTSTWLSASGSAAGPWSEVGDCLGAADLAFDPDGNLLLAHGRSIVCLARPD